MRHDIDRTQLVDDERAIRRIIALYCCFLDQLRFDELGALFARNGIWEAEYGSATGPAAIASLPAGLVPQAPRRKHFVANILIDFLPDRA